ncbi:50S ribosomal protein L6 [Phycisphaerales bacterium AB-hyl4]|uniref:50S ribosomal protein L6 n=1 Tax=Natronomicrosphaera hydrolytica TaxID=3242702 RepID=A0ABV4U9T9_9BACT
MSRIGKQPVPITGNAKVTITGRDIVVEGGSNKLTYTHRPEVTVTVDSDAKQVVVERKNDSRVAKAMHGLTRALIANMIQGVTTGFTRDLEINGVGWNAKVQGMTVALNVGYADTRVVNIPAGVQVDVQQNKIKVTGHDKQAVGQLAAEIRRQRPPEPYNGKGIKYAEEVIVRKEGKAFAGGG